MDEETHVGATQRYGNDPLPGSPNGINVDHEPPPIGVDPTGVVLQPGETLVVYHPHSQRPTRIVPTAELHGPREHIIWHTIKPEDSYAPFPTKADFEQAEFFINNNCSDGYINGQLGLSHKRGTCLKVKTAREMHELLAHGFGENTDDSRVGSICSAIKISYFSQYSISSVGRRSQFHISKASSRRIERTPFVTVPRWMQSSA